VSETKSQKSERLKEEAAKDIDDKYRKGTLWVKEKRK